MLYMEPYAQPSLSQDPEIIEDHIKLHAILQMRRALTIARAADLRTPHRRYISEASVQYTRTHSKEKKSWRFFIQSEWASDTLIMTSLTYRDVHRRMQRASGSGLDAATPPLPFYDRSPGGQVWRLQTACSGSVQYPSSFDDCRSATFLLKSTRGGDRRGPGNGQAAWEAGKTKTACCT